MDTNEQNNLDSEGHEGLGPADAEYWEKKNKEIKNPFETSDSSDDDEYISQADLVGTPWWGRKITRSEWDQEEARARVEMAPKENVEEWDEADVVKSMLPKSAFGRAIFKKTMADETSAHDALKLLGSLKDLRTYFPAGSSVNMEEDRDSDLKLVTRFYETKSGFDNNKPLLELSRQVTVTKGMFIKFGALGPLYVVEDIELHLYDSDENGKAGFRVFCKRK